MSSLPNEVFSDITNFLLNDGITDLMLTSIQFNAFVTPRLQKIKEEMATMNQSIKSPVPEISDDEWISQLNLKQFEPIGSAAKKQMKEMLKNKDELIDVLHNATPVNGILERLKKRLSLERFDDRTFIGILGALVSAPKFRQDYNISDKLSLLYNICLISTKCKFRRSC